MSGQQTQAWTCLGDGPSRALGGAGEATSPLGRRNVGELRKLKTAEGISPIQKAAHILETLPYPRWHQCVRCWSGGVRLPPPTALGPNTSPGFPRSWPGGEGWLQNPADQSKLGSVDAKTLGFKARQGQAEQGPGSLNPGPLPYPCARTQQGQTTPLSLLLALRGRDQAPGRPTSLLEGFREAPELAF